jgi:hypothetical protein
MAELIIKIEKPLAIYISSVNRRFPGAKNGPVFGQATSITNAAAFALAAGGS